MTARVFSFALVVITLSLSGAAQANEPLVLAAVDGFSDTEIYPPGSLQLVTDGVALWQPATAAPGQITNLGAPSFGKVPRPPLHASDPFFAFWADGDPDQLTPSHLYFCDSTGTNGWQLPYHMPDVFAYPQPIFY